MAFSPAQDETKAGMLAALADEFDDDAELAAGAEQDGEDELYENDDYDDDDDEEAASQFDEADLPPPASAARGAKAVFAAAAASEGSAAAPSLKAMASMPPTMATMVSLQMDTNLMLGAMLKRMESEQASAHAQQLLSEKTGEGVTTKEVHLMLEASLRQLADDPTGEAAVLRLSRNAKEKPFPEQPVALVGITVKSVRSSFPCSMVMTAPQLPNLASDNVWTQSGAKGLFKIPAKFASPTNVAEKIVSHVESDWSRTFRQRFPGVTSNNVASGITPLKVKGSDGKEKMYSCIPAESCVARKIVDKREAIGRKCNDIYNERLRQFEVEEAEATLAINEIQADLATQMRTVDLNDLRFKLDRAFVSEQYLKSKGSVSAPSQWLDTAELSGFVKSGNIAAELGKMHYVELVVNVQYVIDK